ncbi:MAG TPA: hypothetical protein VMY37_03040 [Thermoguttaceae bacterium]|nr:hypothetical protein [Thermoguttaceae bacterium]
MDSDDENSILAQGLIKEFAEHCAAAADNVTVRLFGVQDNEVKRDRTGVLYRVADQHFILTAGHDLQGIVEHDIPLFLLPTWAEQEPIHLIDCQFHGTETHGRDVAAIRLTDRVFRSLPPPLEFLGHNSVDLNTDQGNGPFVIFGYPMQWPDRHDEGIHHTKAMVFVAQPYTGERHPDAFYDPKVNVILGFDRNSVDLGTQTDFTLPHPRGISGCGIWRSADWRELPRKSWADEKPRLVGLQHHYFRDSKYVQGTWIAYALELIVDSYPELGNSMNLIYPR